MWRTQAAGDNATSTRDSQTRDCFEDICLRGRGCLSQCGTINRSAISDPHSALDTLDVFPFDFYLSFLFKGMCISTLYPCRHLQLRGVWRYINRKTSMALFGLMYTGRRGV